MGMSKNVDEMKPVKDKTLPMVRHGGGSIIV